MGSRDRADRLLQALRRDLKDVPKIDASDADRVFSELVAAGELSEKELDDAFDRRFPVDAAESPELTVGAAVLHLLDAKGLTPDQAATKYVLAVSVVQLLLQSTEALDSKSSVRIARALAAQVAAPVAPVLTVLKAALVGMRLADSDGPVLRAARTPPSKPK